MKKETAQFLGLLRKGGNLIAGKAVEEAIPKASLILLANDVGEAVGKSLLDKAHHYGKRVLILDSKALLGQAIGMEEVSALAILHPKAAKKVLSIESNEAAERSQS